MTKIFLFPISFIVVFMLMSCRKNPANGGGHPPTCCDRFDFRLTDYEPAWSPDGKTIAYVHGDSAKGKSGIYLIDPSGNNKRLFYASPGAYSPTWSPDGQWIAFSDGGQIFKMKINGDSLTQLTSEGRNFFPDWSPDGLKIAYSESICNGPGTCGIWIMSDNSTKHKFIADYGNYPDWNPQKSQMIYLTRVVKSNGQTLGDSLWIYDAITDKKKSVVFLNDKNYDNRFLRYSPDGTKILFTSQAEGAPPQIWAMNSDGSHPNQLTTTQGYTCDWSPDGEKIVYTDSRAVSGRLWIMNSDGSGKRQLTFNK